MRVDKGRPRPAARRGPAKKPPLVAKNILRGHCIFCRRDVAMVFERFLSWHTVDPSAWRGTWCEGSLTNATPLHQASPE